MFQVTSRRRNSILNSCLMVLVLASLGACQGRRPEEIRAPERFANRETTGAEGTIDTSTDQGREVSQGKTDTAIPVQPKIETGTVPAPTPAATPATAAATPTTPVVPGPGNDVTSGAAATPSPWLGNSDRGNTVWKLVPEA